MLPNERLGTRERGAALAEHVRILLQCRRDCRLDCHLAAPDTRPALRVQWPLDHAPQARRRRLKDHPSADYNAPVTNLVRG